jgi:hypothetical protein
MTGTALPAIFVVIGVFYGLISLLTFLFPPKKKEE